MGSGLLLVVLVCAKGLAPDACTRETALDVMTQPVPTPFACMLGGQTMAAREGLDAATYAKVLCERRDRPPRSPSTARSG
ncbi:hypothetical protein [Methylobacterium sp. JK268]